jgi:exosortase D (VPLPA-CTERM-specific)
MANLKIKVAAIIGAYAFFFFSLYSSTLYHMVTKDWERQGFSHCYLIPLIVIYLIWIKKEELKEIASASSWIGMVPLLIGVLLYFIGELSGEFMTLYLSMWLVIVGLSWIHLGWAKLKVIMFPIFFSLGMFPPPHIIMANLTLKLQLMASKLGASLIKMLGVPVFLEGNVIHLEYTKLQVVEACSGLNSLISLMVLSLLLAYFYKDHLLKRAVLFLSSIPLAIVLNGSRIMITAVLYKYFGPKVADGFFHSFSGIVIFIVSIPILLLIMNVLQKLPPQSKKVLEAKPNTIDESGKAIHAKQVYVSGFGLKIICIVVLFISTLVFSKGINFHKKTQGLHPFSSFPLIVENWSARERQDMESIFLDSLDLSDYTIIDYYNPQGQSVNLYVAYYESQSKGESIHSPATCLPGSGWNFNQSGIVTIPLTNKDKGDLVVKRAMMQKGNARQLSYFWFPQRGRILTNAYQLKFFTFWDSLMKQRSDGALVRLITPIYENETVGEAEERIKRFAIDIVDVLDDFIPGSEI